jgi:hypothetical protein
MCFKKVIQNYLAASFLSFACSRDTTRLQSTHHLRIGLNDLTLSPQRWHLIIELPFVSLTAVV